MKKSVLGFISCIFIGNVSASVLGISPLHPIRSAERVVVGAVLIRGAVSGTVAYLLVHPDKVAGWLSTHPDEIEPLTNYVDKKIEKAHTQAEYNKYSKFKQQLALDSNVNQAQAISIESDPDWQSLKQEVLHEISNVDRQLNHDPHKCNINVVKQLLRPTKDFELDINAILPKVQHTPTGMLDVNTYDRLSTLYKPAILYTKLTHDHIPSYAALKLYFVKHGIAMPNVRLRTDVLVRNSSAITIPEVLHAQGSRTFGGRNNTKDTNGDKTSQQDASDLWLATVKDITTVAYGFYRNPQFNVSPNLYIQQAMTLYVRNRLLCMYDVK